MDLSPGAWWRIANTLEDIEDALGEVEFKVLLEDSRRLRLAKELVRMTRQGIERSATLSGFAGELPFEPQS